MLPASNPYPYVTMTEAYNLWMAWKARDTPKTSYDLNAEVLEAV
jgi:hypothetical protein